VKLPASVIIAAHTEERWGTLMRAIESAQAQRPPAEQIIVAIDNNPALTERLRGLERPLAVVENRLARGASNTRNAGAAAARTPFLVFLDDDACARADWMAPLLEPFADELVVGTGGFVAPLWRTARPRWFPDEFAWVVGASYAGLPATTAPVRNVWSENMAVRADAFRAVGGFRAGFGKVGNMSRPEDTDLCIRMSAARPGAHWVYVPAAVVDHEVPAERATFRFFLVRSFWEGRGKIEMSRNLGDAQDLTSESRWLRDAVAGGAARRLRSAAARASGTDLAQAGALLAGTLAAGLGAAASLARRPRRAA
jgi:cellulose synthase/poly-beta-1,6-N-acetylglucosamine synthase-like glycosyltransferase